MIYKIELGLMRRTVRYKNTEQQYVFKLVCICEINFKYLNSLRNSGNMDLREISRWMRRRSLRVSWSGSETVSGGLHSIVEGQCSVSVWDFAFPMD